MTPARKRRWRGKPAAQSLPWGADTLTGERQACVEAGSTPKHHSQSGCWRVAGEGPLVGGDHWCWGQKGWKRIAGWVGRESGLEAREGLPGAEEEAEKRTRQSKVSGPAGRVTFGRVQPALEGNEGPTKTQKSPEATEGAPATQPQFLGEGSRRRSSVSRFGEAWDGLSAERPVSGLGCALQVAEVRSSI